MGAWGREERWDDEHHAEHWDGVAHEERWDGEHREVHWDDGVSVELRDGERHVVYLDDAGHGESLACVDHVAC